MPSVAVKCITHSPSDRHPGCRTRVRYLQHRLHPLRAIPNFRFCSCLELIATIMAVISIAFCSSAQNTAPPSQHKAHDYRNDHAGQQEPIFGAGDSRLATIIPDTQHHTNATNDTNGTISQLNPHDCGAMTMSGCSEWWPITNTGWVQGL